MAFNSPVTALIVTFAPDRDVLSACIESLRAQNPRPKILIADNFCMKDFYHEVAKSFEADDCHVVANNSNFGFPGAINRVLDRIETPYILISNYDIVYDPDYLSSALSRLESSSKDIIGIAGKTLFYPPNADEDWPGKGPGDPKPLTGKGTGGVIDNTGTLVNGFMLAYNRGVGQIDIGQYDMSDQPMGACFAAFLVRTDAFNPITEGGVGLLDPGYFMYYEDIDWCYRANTLGFKIMYEPRAVAWHHHSLTTRGLPIFYKYHLIQRNLYRTIMKNMRFRTVIRLWWMHARLHIRRARIQKEFGTVTANILSETLLWAPYGLIKRIPIQVHRMVSDTDIVNLSIGEEGYLDDLTLRPQLNWANALASLTRLKKLFPDDPACDLIPDIESLNSGDGDRETVEKVLRDAEILCPSLVSLLKQIK